MDEAPADKIDELTALKGCWTRVRYVLYASVILLIIAGIVDYQRYHAKIDRAMTVVSELGGRAGSLLDWPFGREYAISFDRPLTDDELERLSVVNSLQGRHYVSVFFRCQLSPEELEAARKALPDCAVGQVDD